VWTEHLAAATLEAAREQGVERALMMAANTLSVLAVKWEAAGASREDAEEESYAWLEGLKAAIPEARRFLNGRAS
jgi:hypothetical protein